MATHGPKVSPQLKCRGLLAPTAVRLRFCSRSPSSSRPQRDRPLLRRRCTPSRPQQLLFALSWPNTTKPLSPLQPPTAPPPPERWPLPPRLLARPRGGPARPSAAPGEEGPARSGAVAVGPGAAPPPTLRRALVSYLSFLKACAFWYRWGRVRDTFPFSELIPRAKATAGHTCPGTTPRPLHSGPAASPLARGRCLYNPLPATVRYLFASSRPPSLRRGASVAGAALRTAPPLVPCSRRLVPPRRPLGHSGSCWSR